MRCSGVHANSATLGLANPICMITSREPQNGCSRAACISRMIPTSFMKQTQKCAFPAQLYEDLMFPESVCFENQGGEGHA